MLMVVAWTRLQQPQLGMLLVPPRESFKPCGKHSGGSSVSFGQVLAVVIQFDTLAPWGREEPPGAPTVP